MRLFFRGSDTESVEPNRYSRAVLFALNRHDASRNPKHIYAGTVPAHVVRARRRRNKAARISRRINRRSQA